MQTETNTVKADLAKARDRVKRMTELRDRLKKLETDRASHR